MATESSRGCHDKWRMLFLKSILSKSFPPLPTPLISLRSVPLFPIFFDLKADLSACKMISSCSSSPICDDGDWGYASVGRPGDSTSLSSSSSSSSKTSSFLSFILVLISSPPLTILGYIMKLLLYDPVITDLLSPSNCTSNLSKMASFSYVSHNLSRKCS
ncbi:hypothetical protein PGUG_03699 [Meyerozyma guilliermondii ATCC 6260]|uniref:Uncharacterized protein n=1 Tax=Meyerozyma guilliermondii (strain ATCC 6260 / CBS 566 / DSM 6381 / JCM 1539 / NBRC 10279 / NRRL Y-324) TaxID=294746 RepID=A5DK98_PICGU|nr:uncharacterized protein PGUG_03699 [Meyerozyma guilliermondii ATCC 6260]EDK39600.2 hypothetical protein PGUG_03699 [Meyerozyma guilliermondii ATCC 6260]